MYKRDDKAFKARLEAKADSRDSQKEVTFIIDEQGHMTYLMTQAAPPLEGVVIHRGSHVEPANAFLRAGFHLLRRWLGDKGRMSEFTRNWNCLWRVNLFPVGGPILSTLYYDRQQAINAEIVALNNHFTWRKYEY